MASSKKRLSDEMEKYGSFRYPIPFCQSSIYIVDGTGLKRKVFFMDNNTMLLEIRDILDKSFPGIISKVVMYGSQVTGGAREGSDVDVLVIIKAQDDWRLKRRILDSFYCFDLRHNVLTDVTVLTEDEMGTITGRQPFIQEAIETGISA
jgi:predicted nucleotidyltransferase